MRNKDLARAGRLDALLRAHDANVRRLPGVGTNNRLNCLIEQIIESERRVKFVKTLSLRPISPQRANPHSGIFDPLRAAVWLKQNGHRDEAFWLVFLATHFSKHNADKWNLMKSVYGKLGDTPFWNWSYVRNNPRDFENWVSANYAQLTNFRFGNHRKYESLKPFTQSGLPAVIHSYIDWMRPYNNHDDLVADIVNGANDLGTRFNLFFEASSQLNRFGRLGNFDYVTMLSKVGLIDAEPSKAYLKGATGPRFGVNLLLNNDKDLVVSVREGEQALIDIGQAISTGQQVLEDAICNWQKSPDTYVAFR